MGILRDSLVLPAHFDANATLLTMSKTKEIGVTRQNARNWMFTQHDLDAFWKCTLTEHYAFQYMVYQIEECPKTTAWHAQGFVQFMVQVRGSTVKNMVGGNAHIEVAHMPALARKYCMKDETRLTPPVEYGKWNEQMTQGHRTDLTVAKYKIRELGSFTECLDCDSLDKVTASYPKWVSAQLEMVQRPIREAPNVTVYFGPTLTGKTFRCHAENPGIHELRYNNGFMNYSGQKCVLFDEFDKAPWPFDLILKLLDRYPFQVNVKNGYCWWEVTDIFMTGTESPEKWFVGTHANPDHIPQFMRRITRIVDTTGIPTPSSPEITDAILVSTQNFPELTPVSPELPNLDMDIDSDTEYNTM